MNGYYILYFRDGERMNFEKRCKLVDVAAGLVCFKNSNKETLAMVPMHAIRMIELVEEDV